MSDRQIQCGYGDNKKHHLLDKERKMIQSLDRGLQILFILAESKARV